MERSLFSVPDPLTYVRCPYCRASLEWYRPSDHGLVQKAAEASLRCAECCRTFPVVGGVIRFVTEEGYTSSFGRQWLRFQVARPQEDRQVFRAKTGCWPEELAGQDVLDAGCGGGRYTRLLAEAGAHVVALDRSRAVEAAARLCCGLSNVLFLQGDLLALPLREARFDFVFSLGVLHHCPSPRRAFAALAKTVRPGGRLVVWLYRKNRWLQEKINALLRSWTLRMRPQDLEDICRGAAVLGAIPIGNRLLNKVVNFSNHPEWELRVCDTFDWYSCRYQSHHSVDEVARWFAEEGFADLQVLPPLRTGRLYQWAYERNLIPGSGVNVVGRKQG
jgi:SAM-dependent methyltransferase